MLSTCLKAELKRVRVLLLLLIGRACGRPCGRPCWTVVMWAAGIEVVDGDKGGL